MDRLNREQERTIRIIHKHRRENGNRPAIECECGDRDLVLEIVNRGFAKLHSSRREDGDCDCLQVSLTSAGRCYFQERRRDFIQRYVPVVLSGVLGVAGTMLGAILGAYLAGWRP